jgi:hypothetical protein
MFRVFKRIKHFLEIIGVIAKDKIVKSTKCWWETGLNPHIKFRHKSKNAEPSLHNPKEAFNDVASRGMAQIE